MFCFWFALVCVTYRQCDQLVFWIVTCWYVEAETFILCSFGVQCEVMLDHNAKCNMEDDP